MREIQTDEVVSTRIHTRSIPRPPARVDIKKINVSLSVLLYSFMLSCLAESAVCPSMLHANTDILSEKKKEKEMEKKW